tara:strand:+ start:3657 stop:3953 length:297 start_codon:yes stop_codon:yes gene_type:complete
MKGAIKITAKDGRTYLPTFTITTEGYVPSYGWAGINCPVKVVPNTRDVSADPSPVKTINGKYIYMLPGGEEFVPGDEQVRTVPFVDKDAFGGNYRRSV